jgi:DNA-nicking Smr family endonuclease
MKDLEIWLEYAKTVNKIDNSNVEYHKEETSKAVKITVKSEMFNKQKYATQSVSTSLLPVVQLNRNEQKKFYSGATKDFHGHTREIDNELEKFILGCISRSIKYVTIITGKGKGIVKQAVLTWLSSRSDIVTGFFEIKDSSGKSGSFGVRLKSK